MDADVNDYDVVPIECSWSYELILYKKVIWYSQIRGGLSKTIWRAEGSTTAHYNQPEQETTGRITSPSSGNFDRNHLLVMSNPTYDEEAFYFCRLYISESVYESNHIELTVNGKYKHLVV